MPIKIGLDLIEKHWPDRLRSARVGLVVHPASVNMRFEHTVEIFLKSKQCEVTALFGPQHGIRGETQDNMVEWRGFHDWKTGLPVFSLYGGTRKPGPAMMKNIDVLVIDLQDVGSRYYTFIWTMELCMRSCFEMGKSVVVLDRPNPLGGVVAEGPVLDPFYASFVGQRPLPVRHGMTVAEIGQYFRAEFYPSLDVHVIAMKGWKRGMWFNDTGLPWIMPSPNMPTPETACVYPGICLLEGTTLSEGRGTTRPFEIFGAPFIDPDSLVKRLRKFALPGTAFRPLYFKPAFQKHAGRLCGGAQLHVTDRERFRPFKTGVAVLKAAHDIYGERPLWRNPPYEYETEKLPIDILCGTDRIRKEIQKSENLENMEARWKEECLHFRKTVRKRFLIYD